MAEPTRVDRSPVGPSSRASPAPPASCPSPRSSPPAARPAVVRARAGQRRRRRQRRAPSVGDAQRRQLQLGSRATRRRAWRTIDAAFTAATGIAVKMNTVDHNTFQDQISNYLGAHAGHGLHVVLRVPHEVLRRPGLQHPDRRRVGQGQGQLHRRLRQRRSSATTARSTASRSTTTRGRSSTARASSPTRATPSRRPGTSSWPCARRCRPTASPRSPSATRTAGRRMGTFDILNLRLNGYDFHVGLMAGKEKWTDPKVTAVFQKWAEILPFHAKDYAGLKWQDAAEHARPEEVRACTCSACSCRPSSSATKDPADLADLDFFPFPTLGHAVRRREAALDAPIDTWQIAAKSPEAGDRASMPRRPTSSSGPRARPRSSYSRTSRASIPTAKDADTSTYSDLQKKAVEIVGSAKRITQFLDRDTRVRLRRRERHAELPPEVPGQPDPGPRRLPEDHPGLLGCAAPAQVISDAYPDAMSGPTASRPLPPCPSPQPGGAAAVPPRKRRRYSLLTRPRQGRRWR